MPADSFKRLVAKKININDVINGKYIKEDGNNPNYIILQEGKKVSRVNVMAVVLSKSIQEDTNYSSVVLDDGTATISVRSFEKNENIDNLGIGDIVLLIGKIREFSGERYILPEIIKKIINEDWIKVRKLELRRHQKTNENVIEEKRETKEPVLESSSQVIYNLIKSLDNGNGVDVDSVIKNSKFDYAEKIISNLLKEGEVFELKPGKLKVLE